VFFFKYRDGAPMLTLGWVFFDEGQRGNFDNCGFFSLRFTSTTDQPFSIDVPLITNAEVRAINRCSEQPGGTATTDLPIPNAEVAKYQQLKRYWPTISAPELT
jgi:hypothetical protein